MGCIFGGGVGGNYLKVEGRCFFIAELTWSKKHDSEERGYILPL